MAEKQNQEVKHLIRIERQIDEIKKRTGNPVRAFVGGLLAGAGWIVGLIIAVGLLGWALSIMGFIPGLSEIAAYLQGIVAHWQVR